MLLHLVVNIAAAVVVGVEIEIAAAVVVVAEVVTAVVAVSLGGYCIQQLHFPTGGLYVQYSTWCYCRLWYLRNLSNCCYFLLSLIH